jgi:hypothetical protein
MSTREIGVTYKILYDAIDTLRKENNERFDRIEAIFDSFHKEEFVALDKKVDKIWTYGTMGIAVLSFAATAVWEWIKERMKI